MKVLIAIDSSDSSQAVIDHTAARSWPQGTAIHVLNVVDTTALVSAWVNVGPFVESLTAAGQALVESAAKRLARPGVAVSPSVVTVAALRYAENL